MTPGIEIFSYGPGPAASHGSRRRRLTAILVVLGIAAAGGLIGRLSHPADSAHMVAGPYSYFPS
ncbi:hypothetical protein [Phenylobacterium aquaticum]|uniref:hypothetical protein n=1 Tax=Phenylobacterium aquaticum TaxID=1763816 RepID=UPI0026F30B8B|nr:hypothetical protein [Phenylobacterium aquaticum]